MSDDPVEEYFGKVKLSLRVRPDCEVAPWVLVEIRLLEAEIARLHKELDLKTPAGLREPHDAAEQGQSES
jgi:hypothetical protein